MLDAGPGCITNYNCLQVPMSRMNKIFLTHLHLDHTSDLGWIYSFGPVVDRSHPAGDLRPNRHDARARHQIQHRGRPEGAHQMEPGQLSPPHVRSTMATSSRYTNSITSRIRVSPIRKTGSRSNTGLPFMSSTAPSASNWNGTDSGLVWSGDTQPNQYIPENAKGVDLLIHETAPDPARYAMAQNMPLAVAKNVVKVSHTPAKALGKISKLTKPRLGVTCHSPVDPQEYDIIHRGIHKHWDGPYNR